MTKFDFNDRPFIVIWEVTRACSLACRHCRAEASLGRHPLELNTAEAFRFIEQVERCRPTLFVMTGGDPIRRNNLKTLIRYATDRGLRVSLSPSATPEFAGADLGLFKDAGVERLSLSLDGASRETHDQFRGVPGTWNWTMEAIANAALAGIPIQINTTFTRQNLGNVKQRRFSEIWSDSNNETLSALRNRSGHLEGKCASCRFLNVCGGGFRVRAVQVHGNLWAPDPACYLSDDEVAVVETTA